MLNIQETRRNTTLSSSSRETIQPGDEKSVSIRVRQEEIRIVSRIAGLATGAGHDMPAASILSKSRRIPSEPVLIAHDKRVDMHGGANAGSSPPSDAAAGSPGAGALAGGPDCGIGSAPGDPGSARKIFAALGAGNWEEIERLIAGRARLRDCLFTVGERDTHGAFGRLATLLQFQELGYCRAAGGTLAPGATGPDLINDAVLATAKAFCGQMKPARYLSDKSTTRVFEKTDFPFLEKLNADVEAVNVHGANTLTFALLLSLPLETFQKLAGWARAEDPHWTGWVDGRGMTPLATALECGLDRIADWLLRQGAGFIDGRADERALEMAVRAGRGDVVAHLLDRGGDGGDTVDGDGDPVEKALALTLVLDKGDLMPCFVRRASHLPTGAQEDLAYALLLRAVGENSVACVDALLKMPPLDSHDPGPQAGGARRVLLARNGRNAGNPLRWPDTDTDSDTDIPADAGASPSAHLAATRLSMAPMRAARHEHEHEHEHGLELFTVTRLSAALMLATQHEQGQRVARLLLEHGAQPGKHFTPSPAFDAVFYDHLLRGEFAREPSYYNQPCVWWTFMEHFIKIGALETVDWLMEPQQSAEASESGSLQSMLGMAIAAARPAVIETLCAPGSPHAALFTVGKYELAQAMQAALAAVVPQVTDGAGERLQVVELLVSLAGAETLKSVPGLAYDAARIGSRTILERLVREGIDIAGPAARDDGALTGAIVCGRDDVVEFLLGIGVAEGPLSTKVWLQRRFRKQLVTPDASGRTPLQLAAALGKWGICDILSDRQLASIPQESFSQPALDHALCHAVFGRRPAAVRDWLNRGASVDFSINGRGILGAALLGGDREIVSMLLARKARLMDDELADPSVLAHLNERGDRRLMQLVCAPDLLAQCIGGQAPAPCKALISEMLYTAAAVGAGHAVTRLALAGGSPDHVSTGGSTLLMRAVRHGNPQALSLLLREGADPAVFIHGKNAFLAAVEAGDLDAMRLMLDARPSLFDATDGLRGPAFDLVIGANAVLPFVFLLRRAVAHDAGQETLRWLVERFDVTGKRLMKQFLLDAGAREMMLADISLRRCLPAFFSRNAGPDREDRPLTAAGNLRCHAYVLRPDDQSRYRAIVRLLGPAAARV